MIKVPSRGSFSVPVRWLVPWLLLACAARASDDDLVRRGEYIMRAAGCVACHTDVDNEGALLAGGRAFETPFGVFYSPNITPDPEHGISRWREADLVRALSEGVGPDGADYYPVFPYTAYTRMRRDDVGALWAYLASVEPVARPNSTHELPWYMGRRLVNWFWKWLNFDPGVYRDRLERSAAWNRGAYLAEALAHCGECHTPRNWLGALEAAMRYAGTREGPEGERVPNITPDRKTGIGRWSHDDLVYYLETGMTPGGDYAGSLMAEVIDEGLGHLTDADRQAIATYVLALPPIEHAVKTTGKPREKDEFE